MALATSGSVAPIGRIIPINSVSRRYRGAAIRSLVARQKEQSISHPRPVQTAIAHVAKAVEQVYLAKQLIVERLKNIDGRVRAHEQAHIASAGPYARSGPNYIYVIGPDGRLYAVGGSVSVDLRPIPGNPEATIRKARMVRRAALGPMQPSPQDLRIVAATYSLEMEARRELAREEAQEEAEKEVKENREAEAGLGRYIDVYA